MGLRRHSWGLLGALLLGCRLSAATTLNDVESLLQQHVVQEEARRGQTKLAQPAEEEEDAPGKDEEESEDEDPGSVELMSAVPEEERTKPDGVTGMELLAEEEDSHPVPHAHEKKPHPLAVSAGSARKSKQAAKPASKPAQDVKSNGTLTLGPLVNQSLSKTQVLDMLRRLRTNVSQSAALRDLIAIFKPMTHPPVRGKAVKKSANVDGDFVIDMTWDEYVADQLFALLKDTATDSFKKGVKLAKDVSKKGGKTFKHSIIDASKMRNKYAKHVRKSVQDRLGNLKTRSLQDYVNRGLPLEDKMEKRREIIHKKVNKLVYNRKKKVLTPEQERVKHHKDAMKRWSELESEQRQMHRRAEAVHWAAVEHEKAIRERLFPNYWPGQKHENEDEEEGGNEDEDNEDEDKPADTTEPPAAASEETTPAPLSSSADVASQTPTAAPDVAALIPTVGARREPGRRDKEEEDEEEKEEEEDHRPLFPTAAPKAPDEPEPWETPPDAMFNPDGAPPPKEEEETPPAAEPQPAAKPEPTEPPPMDADEVAAAVEKFRREMRKKQQEKEQTTTPPAAAPAPPAAAPETPTAAPKEAADTEEENED